MNLRFLIVFLFLPFCLSAQQQIEIVQANELSGFETSEGKFQRLTGNVILKQDNAVMHCDSAWLDKKQNSFEAFGQVNINQNDSINLYGKYLKYYGNEKKAYIKDEVRLTDREMTLTTSQLDYDLNQKIGYYTTGGDIVNKDDHLTSQIGTYHAQSKTMGFKQDVVLVNPEFVMNCDTLYYNTETKTAFFFGPTTIKGKEANIYCENGKYDTETNRARFSINAIIHNNEYILKADSLIYGGDLKIDTAIRNVVMIDTLNKLDIRGNFGIYNRIHKRAYVTDRANANFDMDGDTLFLASDTLLSVTDTNRNDNRQIYAFHHVRYYKSDMQGVCDSMYYSQADSMMWMLGEPVLWNENQQMTGDTVELLMSENRVREAQFIRNSFIIEKIDSTIFNQVSGRKTTCFFSENKLRSALIEGNATCIYYLEEDTATISGVFKVTSSSMLIEVDSNEVSDITFYQSPEGTLYPLSAAPAESQYRLEGFDWLDYLRPKERPDIFTRLKKIRPEKKGKK